MAQDSATKAQASLEMTVALIGALLLLFGSFKVMLWAWQRLIARQDYYEHTRVTAGSTSPNAGETVIWDDASSKTALRIFE